MLVRTIAALLMLSIATPAFSQSAPAAVFRSPLEAPIFFSSDAQEQAEASISFQDSKWRLNDRVSIDVLVSGSPARIEVDGLPEGLELDRSSNRIVGQTMVEGRHDLVARALDADGDLLDRHTGHVHINPLLAPHAESTVWHVGDQIDLLPEPSGLVGSATWSSIGSLLPFALVPHPTSGRLVGTASEAGVFDGLVLSLTDDDDARSAPTNPFSITVEELPVFVSHVFTSCGLSGRSGPTQEDCLASYGSSMGSSQYSVSAGVQIWTVPETGTYRIEAAGAAGGSNRWGTGGSGAIMAGNFSLQEGETIKIVVGHKTSTADNFPNQGGGGGSFVWKGNYDLLVAAGGGGGAGGGAVVAAVSGANGRNASTGLNGTAAINSTKSVAPFRGVAGTNGNGGNAGAAGWLSNGAIPAMSDSPGVPYAPRNGALGGTSGVPSSGEGGFGGGGGAANIASGGAGGGGGYSGGASNHAHQAGGGGGGSFNAGASPTASVGNTSSGRVTITKL